MHRSARIVALLVVSEQASRRKAVDLGIVKDSLPPPAPASEVVASDNLAA